MKRLLIAAVALVAMGSCTDSDPIASSESLEAKFSSVITKVVNDTSWESTDEVGIIVIDKEGEVSSFHPLSARHTVSTDGMFTPYNEANTIYYSTDPYDYINFYAYYPYCDDLGEDLIYKINIANQSEPTLIDFMEAHTNDNNNCESDTPVQFIFTRRLTKFTINLIAGSGFELDDVTAVRIEGFYTTADYDLWNREFQNITYVQDITPYNDDNTYSAILIPMVDGYRELYSLDESNKVVIEIGDQGEIVWELIGSENDTQTKNPIVLKAGSEHTFNLTLTREDVGSSGTIQEWTEVNNAGDFTTDNN